MSDLVGAAPRASRRRWLVAAVITAVTVTTIVALGGWWFFTEGPGARIISPPRWQIEWHNDGKEFGFAIRGDRDYGTVINVHESTSGLTSPVAAGSYYLEIAADGPWSIKVVRGE